MEFNCVPKGIHLRINRTLETNNSTKNASNQGLETRSGSSYFALGRRATFGSSDSLCVSKSSIWPVVSCKFRPNQRKLIDFVCLERLYGVACRSLAKYRFSSSKTSQVPPVFISSPGLRNIYFLVEFHVRKDEGFVVRKRTSKMKNKYLDNLFLAFL